MVVVAPFRLNILVKVLTILAEKKVSQNGLRIPMLGHWLKHTQNQSQSTVCAHWLAVVKVTFLMALVEGRFRIVSGLHQQRIQIIISFGLTSLWAKIRRWLIPPAPP